MQEIALSISYFVHMIATVAWLGGMAIFLFYIWPTARQQISNQDDVRTLRYILQKRFRPIANLSLVLLLGTGMIQMGVNENYEGVLTFTNTWTIAMLFKHLAFVGMVIIVGLVHFNVVPDLERAMLLSQRGKTAELDRLLDREVTYTRLLLGLGIMVLICTAIATAV